jgi:hypothetical protein
MSRMTVTADRLTDRRAHYFMDQQIGLHGTIVSIALGVAGLAAASLFEVRSVDRPYQALLWVLWMGSLLAVAVVYSGMTVSVYALPSTIPTATDMFLPFGIALTEFMLFAVLTTPLTAQLAPRSIVALWFGCLCLFGCFASIIIQRVRWLFEHTEYDPPAAQKAVCSVAALMRNDFQGASGTAVLSAVAAILIEWDRAMPLGLAYYITAALSGGMSYGVFNQRRQAQILETELSRIPTGAADKREGLAKLELVIASDPGSATDGTVPNLQE